MLSLVNRWCCPCSMIYLLMLYIYFILNVFFMKFDLNFQRAVSERGINVWSIEIAWIEFNLIISCLCFMFWPQFLWTLNYWLLFVNVCKTILLFFLSCGLQIIIFGFSRMKQFLKLPYFILLNFVSPAVSPFNMSWFGFSFLSLIVKTRNCGKLKF